MNHFKKPNYRIVTFAMGGNVKAAIETYKSALRDEVAYLKSQGIDEENVEVLNYMHHTTVSVDGQIIVRYNFDYNQQAPDITAVDQARIDAKEQK
jgi:hypothetical protein